MISRGQDDALTNDEASPIARITEMKLSTAAQEALTNGYPVGALVAQVDMIDVLYTCMAPKRHEETDLSQARIAEALHRRQG